MSSSPSDLPRLGSLAQSARIKQLNQARILLFVAGGLVIFGAGLEMAVAKSAITKAGEQQNPRATPTELKEETDRLLRFVYLVDSARIVVGVVFIGFGFLIRLYPVPVTVIALVLYLGMIAALALIDPATLLSGWIIKLIVVIGLVKALQAALAYQREQARVSELEPNV